LKVDGAGGVRQTEVHTAEETVPESGASEVQFAARNLKLICGTALADHRTISTGGETLGSNIDKRIKKFGLPVERVGGRNLPRKAVKPTAVLIDAHHCCQLHTKFYPTSFSVS
jgi:hypothetical protein